MNSTPDTGPYINPVTGLPLIEDTYIDVGGNPYGTDLYTWEPPAYEPEPVYIPPPPCFDAF
jgi:hypothetical protein